MNHTNLFEPGPPEKRPRLPLTTTSADEYFSKYIRARDSRCFFGCGRPATQNSHFWGRGHSSTRYDPLNCDGVCGGCHMTHEGSKQGLYRELKIKQLGMRQYNLMEKRARSILKRQTALLQCEALLRSVGWL